MKLFKLSVTILAITLFLMACNTDQPQQTLNANQNAVNGTLSGEMVDANNYWAKDNLDLQRVGDLLEKSNSPEEFEGYLNSYDGINNLDLNGDGYVDYISVAEYQDRDDYSRGMSIYSRFGPDLIQEIAQIVLYRDDIRSPGARILVTGNQQMYGDNYHYETNWLDRSLGIASLLFGQRDSYYRSPYYYNSYPDNYRTYQVVETPYYRTRIEQLYPRPIFAYTTNPVWINKIKIKSPNNGLHLGQIKARFVKPTKEQEVYLKNNPGRPPFAKFDKPGRQDKVEKDNQGGKKDVPSRSDIQPRDDRKGQPHDAKPSRPAKVENPKGEKPNVKSSKPDKGGQNKGKGKGNPKEH